MSTQEDVYVMPSFPMLAVSDVAATAAWYQEVLGFRHVFTMTGPGGRPVLEHLRWARYADLLLTARAVRETGPRGTGVTLYFQMHPTGRTVDELADTARAKGANVVEGPIDTPWNAREVTILDRDGYRLTFTQAANPGRSFDDVLRAARGEEQ